MTRWIAVFHSWHVHSKGFDVVELEAKTYDMACSEAAVINYKKNRPFNETAFTLIEIGDNESVVKKPRKKLFGLI